MITDGKASAKLASTPPITPEVLKPAKVDMFTPMGPGVDSATAIISAMSECVNQFVLSDIAYKNGRVAKPPPTENKPVFMNSYINLIKVMANIFS